MRRLSERGSLARIPVQMENFSPLWEEAYSFGQLLTEELLSLDESAPQFDEHAFADYIQYCLEADYGPREVLPTYDIGYKKDLTSYDLAKKAKRSNIPLGPERQVPLVHKSAVGAEGTSRAKKKTQGTLDALAQGEHRRGEEKKAKAGAQAAVARASAQGALSDILSRKGREVYGATPEPATTLQGLAAQDAARTKATQSRIVGKAPSLGPRDLDHNRLFNADFAPTSKEAGSTKARQSMANVRSLFPTKLGAIAQASLARDNAQRHSRAAEQLAKLGVPTSVPRPSKKSVPEAPMSAPASSVRRVSPVSLSAMSPDEMRNVRAAAAQSPYLGAGGAEAQRAHQAILARKNTVAAVQSNDPVAMQKAASDHQVAAKNAALTAQTSPAEIARSASRAASDHARTGGWLARMAAKVGDRVKGVVASAKDMKNRFLGRTGDDTEKMTTGIGDALNKIRTRMSGDKSIKADEPSRNLYVPSTRGPRVGPADAEPVRNPNRRLTQRRQNAKTFNIGSGS